jgi:hypothetical protein
MNRLTTALTVASLAMGALGAAANAAPSDYGIKSVGASTSTTQAGGHPDFETAFELKTEEGESGPRLPSTTGSISFTLPPGLLANPQILPQCTAEQLLGTDPEVKSNETGCPIGSQIGVTEVQLFKNGSIVSFTEPVFNMEPRYGEPARLGFIGASFPVLIDTEIRPDREYAAVAKVEGPSSLIPLLSADTTLWGVPADKSHDGQRITPYEAVHNGGVPETENGKRESEFTPKPLTLNPTRCGASQGVEVSARPYALPELVSSAFAPLEPNTGCGLLDFTPDLKIAPTTEQAETGSGLNAELTFPTDGLEHQNVLVEAEQKKAEVTLPAGVSVNPSQAEGLGVCSQAEFQRETSAGLPNEGCPETSKIGSVTADSPLVDKPAVGSLYVAKPYENPFGTLIAVYMVLRIPDRGVVVRLPGKVVPDSQTGQLVTTFDNIPQLPVASFQLHFREGARSPLVTPERCGTYTSTATFTAWSGQVETTHPSFQITRGVNGGPCPSGGLPPFHPGLIAGTINNTAGKYSPFNLRLFRNDGEQEITHFSIKLPTGLVGKLAGIPFCPDAAIAAAKARTGPNGGLEELERPSCPAASEIGHTLAGAGVGSVLAYAPGKVYLAGPYHGSALSIAAITAAKVGPFDLGTVVVREALKIDPETAEVFVDATGSDPLPHIIAGVPTHLRDIRVYNDRPEFVLNPTSCKRKSTASTVLGSGLDFASEADDRPVTVSTPFQAADCAALPFKPQLKLRLLGGTTRGAHPSLRARLTMKPGEAGIARTRVTLPGSEFIENAHFNTICTRVQFKQGTVPGEKCPAGSVYGHAKAVTPLLDGPLVGPVYLRSSEHELPDLVVALNSEKINIDLVGHVDSVKGRLRSTFAATPDAPVSSVTLSMQGGRKGLFVNSTNLCNGVHRADVEFTGHNGKEHDFRTALKPKGC